MSPSKEAEELPLLLPEQIPEIARPHRFRTLAGVGFQSPLKIGAPPRSQSITACCIPQESKFFAHIAHNCNICVQTSITSIGEQLLPHQTKEILAP